MPSTPEQPPVTSPAPPAELCWDTAQALLSSLSEPGAGGEAPGLPAIPGYILKSRLGRGGSGEVYLGYRAGSERPLAIKVFQSGVGGSDPRARRAMRELDLLTQLHLPVVPRVIDYGVHDGRLYIAAEHIDGEPLDAAAADLPLRGKVELLAKVADAVQLLHEHGVIHRDLKPANILIDRHGQPILIDLGIASLLEASATDTLTAEGLPIGSPAYMSPEQARGERSRMSTRTDVYGLGATGFVLLAGQSPHDAAGGVHDIIRRIAHEAPRPVQEVDPAIPRPLAAVLNKAVSAVPEERYAGAGDLAADLRRWERGDPVLAQPPSPWNRLVRWSARHPLKVGAVAILATIAVSSAAFNLASNWYFFREPVDIVITDDGQEARLLSRARTVIQSWWASGTPEIGHPVQVALMGRLPQEEGAGRVVLLSSATGRQFGPAQRSLGCFRAGDIELRKPLWVSGSSSPEIVMPPPHGEQSDWFQCAWAGFADVFPEVPGDEVVALHKHFRYGQCALRIYRVSDGEVLYEAWHDGSLGSPIAVSQDAQGAVLIAEGCDNVHASIARPGVPQTYYGCAVLAVRPRLRQHAGWINRPEPQGSRPEVVWYRFVTGPGLYDPADPVAVAGATLHPRFNPAAGVAAELDVTVQWPGAGSSQQSPPGGLSIGIGPDGALKFVHPSDSLGAFKAVLGERPERRYSLTDTPPFPPRDGRDLSVPSR